MNSAINIINSKIDRRKSYYLVLDTETANGLDNPLMYDVGGCICDKRGNVMETFSFVIYEVYRGMRDLMETAYYANKIPMYEEQIKSGQRKIVTLYTAKQHIDTICKKYQVKAIIAHNMRFDYKSTNGTSRYLTKSKYRYFLPYNIPVWCTLRMAQDVICKQKSYRKWCENHHYMTNGRPRATAEILYKYMTGNNDFIESHTGLEDVLIEKEIFAWCVRQHKKMTKSPYKDKSLSKEEKLERGWEV